MAYAVTNDTVEHLDKIELGNHDHRHLLDLVNSVFLGREMKRTPQNKI